MAVPNITLSLKRATPHSLLYLAVDSQTGVGSATTLAVSQMIADAIPDSPLQRALQAVRTDTDAHAIADLFEGPPVGTVNAGGGKPGTGKQTPQAPELRCEVRARGNSFGNAAGTPTPKAWALTADTSGGFAFLVVGDVTAAACDAYIEVRCIHSKAA